MQCREFNANRAAVTKVKRALHARQYPVNLVNPDGSTIRIKYPTPRVIVKLPLDFESASPELQRLIRLSRQSKETVVKKEEVKVAFDPLKYAKKR